VNYNEFYRQEIREKGVSKTTFFPTNWNVFNKPDI